MKIKITEYQTLYTNPIELVWEFDFRKPAIFIYLIPGTALIAVFLLFLVFIISC